MASRCAPRLPALTALFAAAFAFAFAAPATAAVEIDWVPVSGAGNDCVEQSNGCFGGVDYLYDISVYEITNEQYAEFLNAVAAADPNGLYKSNMSNSEDGGINRSGSSGSYAYTVKSNAGDRPVVFVNWYSTLRFANWLHNGMPEGAQDAATTEDGAYTFTGATAVGPRNPGARIVLTNEDEWYKAAYYDPEGDDYFGYPTGVNSTTKCSGPGGDDGNAANCNFVVDRSEDVGSYVLSESPNGTYDQGGNAAEWLEATSNNNRVLRGGSWGGPHNYLSAANRSTAAPNSVWADIGFRVARLPVPAPDAAGLGVAALATLALLRSRRASAPRA